MTPELEQQIRRWASESEGWTTADRCVEMAQLILDTKPQTIVEIGVFGGRSFIPQALALKQNRKEHGIVGRIYGLDPWKKDATIEGYEGNDADVKANKDWWMSVDIHMIHKLAAEAVWKYHVDEHAILIRSASQYCHECIPPIDILVVDGNHSEVASCRDVALYMPKLNGGGYAWMDDCGWPTTQSAQRLMLSSCDLVRENTDVTLYKLFRKR